MTIVIYALGLLIVLLVFFDAFWTVLWPEGGAGPLTDRVGGSTWALAKRLTSRDGKIVHRWLSSAGPVVAGITISVWIVLLIGGLILIFVSHPEAVVDSSTEQMASFVERIWFVLYTVSTMGNGEFKPNTSVFQITTGLASLAGISLLTLIFTFLIQVLNAVVEKRTFAGEVLSLGDSAVEIASALQDARPEGVSTQLASLDMRLASMTQQHKAFPILHYFHPTDQRRSSACAVAALDEALMVYRTGLDEEEIELVASTLRPFQRTIDTFLRSLRGDYFQRSEETPEVPAAQQLERHGFALRRPDNLVEQAEERAEHRRLLHALIEHNGWDWSDVLYGH